MKIFVYKTLVIVTLIFVLYHATIGYQIKNLEVRILNYFDKDKIIYLRKKIREEMSNGVKKDKILSDEDAKIINKFIEKLTFELKNSN